MQHLNRDAASSMAISKAERSFIVAFGQRLAALRKERGLTQVQLADLLDVSQQTVTAYENGTRRVPISTLPTCHAATRSSNRSGSGRLSSALAISRNGTVLPNLGQPA